MGKPDGFKNSFLEKALMLQLLTFVYVEIHYATGKVFECLV